jgi:hypothetical protein
VCASECASPSRRDLFCGELTRHPSNYLLFLAGIELHRVSPPVDALSILLAQGPARWTGNDGERKKTAGSKKRKKTAGSKKRKLSLLKTKRYWTLRRIAETIRMNIPRQLFQICGLAQGCGQSGNLRHESL